MRLYLDNCVLNRPFDDQTQDRINMETMVISEIREKIEREEFSLAWSYLNDFEMSRNPFANIRAAALAWKALATIQIEPSLKMLDVSYDLREMGLKPVDSLHLSAALDAGSSYFISTDDGILSKLGVYRSMRIVDPVTFVDIIRNENDNRR